MLLATLAAAAPAAAAAAAAAGAPGIIVTIIIVAPAAVMVHAAPQSGGNAGLAAAPRRQGRPDGATQIIQEGADARKLLVGPGAGGAAPGADARDAHDVARVRPALGADRGRCCAAGG